MLQAGLMALFTLAVLATDQGCADDSPVSPDKRAEHEFTKVVEKARQDVITQFDTAIISEIEKGNLPAVQGLKVEREAFLKDITALPCHPAMLTHRASFEEAWWEGKAKREQALAASVVELTKAKKFDEAVRIQRVLAEAAKAALVPQDVTNHMPGAWRVSFVGRTKSGSTINYQATWVFDKAGTVSSAAAKVSGIWAYDYTSRSVVVSWANSEKSQEVFPVPIAPSGMTGQTWHGSGVKFTAEKAITPSIASGVGVVQRNKGKHISEGKYTSDDLLKAIRANSEADVNLKTSYQQLVLAYKKAALVTTELATANTAIANPKLDSDVRRQYRGQINKLEADLKARNAAIPVKEAAFQEDQKNLLEDINKTCGPILRGMRGEMDQKAMNAVLALLDLFAFADYKELPNLKIGAAFLDQDAWKEAGRCLAASGIRHLPDLKKALRSTNPAARYAVAFAVTEIGAEVDQLDKDFYAELFGMDTLPKKSTLDRIEQEARQKIVQAALEAIRPNRK